MEAQYCTYLQLSDIVWYCPLRRTITDWSASLTLWRRWSAINTCRSLREAVKSVFSSSYLGHNIFEMLASGRRLWSIRNKTVCHKEANLTNPKFGLWCKLISTTLFVFSTNHPKKNVSCIAMLAINIILIQISKLSEIFRDFKYLFFSV